MAPTPKIPGGSTMNAYNTNPYNKVNVGDVASGSSGGGFQSENIGQAVQGVAGAYGMFANIADTAKAAGEVQYDTPTLMDNNPYERPTYNLGTSWGQNNAFKPEEAGKGLIGQSVMSGAGSGAAIGSLGGPWGTAIGAAAGALTGLVGGLFGRKKARSNAAEAKTRELAQLQETQDEFNTDLTEYDERTDARDSYNKRLTNRRRRIQTVVG